MKSQNKSPRPLYEELMQKALALLAKRSYTVLKLKQKLQEHHDRMVKRAQTEPLEKSKLEIPIKQVLTRLKELKYLNDTEFTKNYIENRIEFRPRGKYLIKRELKQKGIHPDLAERITEETYEDEEEAASRAFAQKLKKIQSYPRPKQKEKAMRYLASRGFRFDTIYKIINNWYNTVE